MFLVDFSYANARRELPGRCHSAIAGAPRAAAARSERAETHPVACRNHLSHVVRKVTGQRPTHEPSERLPSPHRVEPSELSSTEARRLEHWVHVGLAREGGGVDLAEIGTDVHEGRDRLGLDGRAVELARPARLRLVK